LPSISLKLGVLLGWGLFGKGLENQLLEGFELASHVIRSFAIL
jgi:hypothetical protein